MLSKRSTKDIIEETESILVSEAIRDFDKKRTDANKEISTHEVSKALAPLKKKIPNFDTNFKNFRSWQREEANKSTSENQRKLKENSVFLAEQCSLLTENMSPEAKTLSTSACDNLADSYEFLKNSTSDTITQKLYDMFSNACKYGNSMRSCDIAYHLASEIQEKGAKSNIKLLPNLPEIIQQKFHFFGDKCLKEKDGFACSQLALFAAEEKAQLEYAKKACDLGNKVGCELYAETFMSTNTNEAFKYYEKACNLGQGSACHSAFMLNLENPNEKKMQDLGQKTIKAKYCHPSINPHFFISLTTQNKSEAANILKAGCYGCNDAISCFEYDQLLDKFPNEIPDVNEERMKLPQMLKKSCGNTDIFAYPFLIEPCLDLYILSNASLSDAKS
jgi:TPR repeat protein